MRQLPWCVCAIIVACSGNKPDTDVNKGSEQRQQQQGQTVATIVSVTCTVRKSPAQLVVQANGEVPTAGWTAATLNRRTYVAAPADGIWEYDFVASPPAGMAAQMITPISAENTWADYPATVVGVRVYGEGSGIKEISLTRCTTQ